MLVRDGGISAFDFDPRRKAKTYSKGNRQKVALIAAFATPADLYIMDEPTTGLDPAARLFMWDRVRDLQQRGVTVVLTTHDMHEGHRQEAQQALGEIRRQLRATAEQAAAGSTS